jgi:hypothetical protein
MKTLLFGVTLIVLSVRLHSQGTLAFTNRPAFVGGTVAENAIVNCRDGTRLAGTDWLAQLYWALGPGAPESSLKPVGSPVPFATGGAAGFFGPEIIALPGAAGHSVITAQARVWNAAGGTTYEQANQNPFASVGRSGLINVGPLGDPISLTPPATMVGLRGFCVGVPEPTTWALGILGALVLFLKSRRAGRLGHPKRPLSLISVSFHATYSSMAH